MPATHPGPQPRNRPWTCCTTSRPAAPSAGTAVVAGEQTGGRGSRGRDWQSPPGGLWLSVLYSAPAPPPVSSCSACGSGWRSADALEALGPGVPVDLKWPNDLMLGDRKLGGMLCEARWQGDALAWIVAGVGINVANPVPPELGAVGDLARRAAARASRRTLVEPETLAAAPGAGLARRSGWTRVELAALRRRDWLCGRRLRAPAARHRRRDLRGWRPPGAGRTAAA